MRTLLVNANIVTGESSAKGSVAIEDGRIAGIIPQGSHLDFPDAQIVDLEGLALMAGGVDLHVHFREPGMTHKGDLASESAAALLGGVTSFVDMPNTNPPTVSEEALEAKIQLAGNRAWSNYGFNIGATNRNLDEILRMDYSRFAGIKVFMGSSTGNMLVDSDRSLEELFRIRDKAVLIHSEDESIIRENLAQAKARYGMEIPFGKHPAIRSREACIKSTAKALGLAIKYGTKLHILHLTTAEEVRMLREAKHRNPQITAETTPAYLWFCDEDYACLGARIKCNPAIKTSKDRDALRKALEDGLIDTIGSDHAPHLLSEKAASYLSSPSGLPGIKYGLSVLLTIANEGGVSLNRIASAFSEKPAEIAGLRDRGKIEAGRIADLIAVDTDEAFPVSDADETSKCGWTPYSGYRLRGRVKKVFLGGVLAAENGEIITHKPLGQRLVFQP